MKNYGVDRISSDLLRYKSIFATFYMPTGRFDFKQFSVCHDRCAMKVGTDGVLLGAWAPGGKHILDIGTGSGLVAMMMAQRFPNAGIVALEIDKDACEQAICNISQSPFADKIEVICEDASCYVPQSRYDCIVSNPPFFEESLLNPSQKKAVARHSSSLPFHALFSCVSRSLSEEGLFSAIVPDESVGSFLSKGSLAGFFVVRHCAIRTTPKKPIRRHLLSFCKKPAYGVKIEEALLQSSDGTRSEWYNNLTKDFYIR